MKVDLYSRQSLIDYLMAVQTGYVSCRCAATEIQKSLPKKIKKNLTPARREAIQRLRMNGATVKSIAIVYNINPSTVWRICNPKTKETDHV